MLDLMVKGGEVVTPERVAERDIAVRAGQIVAVATPGTITEEARRTVDAWGHIVVPGGVEPHAHIAWPIPAQWAKREGLETQSPDAATRAAVFGGTTTVIDFAVQIPGRLPLEALEQRLGSAAPGPASDTSETSC